MTGFMTGTTVLTVAAALTVALASQASAQTPTLAELAKREEARRKAVTAPARIVTNDDVPKGAAPRPGAPAGEEKAAKPDAKPAAGADDKSAQKPDEPVKDAAWWQKRISTVRDELRRNEMFVDAMQTRINSLSADFAARDDPYQRARVGEERTRAITEMDRVKAEIEEQKKKIAEIEDEARRAGVPPGWLR
jgi:HAMP domain-containing protein